MWSLRGVVVLAGIAASAAACSQIAGFESLDFEADVADAMPDQGIAESGPPTADVNVDGGSDADAATCAHDFCDDFEGVTTPDQRWTGKEIVGTGQLSLVEDPTTLNTYLHSVIARPDASATAHIARVSLQGPATTKPDGTSPKIRLAFRVKVEHGDPNPYGAGLAFIVIGTGPASEDILGIELARDDVDKSKLDVFIRELYTTEAGLAYGGRLSSLTIPVGVWTQVELQVNARPPGGGGGATLTIGGVSDAYTLQSNSRPGYLRVDVGHGFGGVSGSEFASLIDDVAVDYK